MIYGVKNVEKSQKKPSENQDRSKQNRSKKLSRSIMRVVLVELETNVTTSHLT
jgi:hypothetical protein